jgi:hypothetical protein
VLAQKTLLDLPAAWSSGIASACGAGWPDEFVKNSPKYSPTHFLAKYCISLTVENSSPKIRATIVIFKKLLKVNIRPMGENSPNLVTLLRSHGSWVTARV